jgi:hypothetical protein
MNFNNGIIYGNGMAAFAVSKVIDNVKIYASSEKKRNTHIRSKWRNSPIIFNDGVNGLSGYYHGVMPGCIFKDNTLKDGLSVLNLDCNTKNIIFNSYFVPWVVRRPRIKSFSEFDPIAVSDLSKGDNYLCMSVIGNLKFLQQHGYIKNAVISDDIIYKIGTISITDYKKLTHKREFCKKGIFFPIINMKNGFVHFRPIFFRETNINFTNLINSFISNKSVGEFFEKVLRSIYMRFGVLLTRPSKWECFVQVSIKNFYKLKEDGAVEELESARMEYLKSIDAANEYINEFGFKDFKYDNGEVINGIHLGYDRNILKNVPKNIYVFDTSLNNKLGYHPTIVMFCKIVEILKNNK